jgi:hypothetical protein
VTVAINTRSKNFWPAAGFEASAGPDAKVSRSGRDSFELISAARQRGQEIIAHSRRGGSSLSAEDILSLLAMRLKHLVPHDALAVYCPRSGVLTAEFVSGETSGCFLP